MKEREISTEKLIKAIWKKKGLILLCMILSTALTFGIATLLVKPVYETTVMFHLQGMQPAVQVESAVYLLRTRQTLDAVLEQAGVDCTREELEKMLVAKPMGATALLEVTISGQDPDQTKAIADAVAQVLPQRMMQLMQDMNVEIADMPERPEMATRKGMMAYLLSGLLAGLAVPMVVISLREYGNAVQ